MGKRILLDLAAIVLGLAVVLGILAAQNHPTDQPRPAVVNLERNSAHRYEAPCKTASEDSPPWHCEFDPNGRYDYQRDPSKAPNESGGMWVRVPDDHRHANGNQPPTGQQLIESIIQPDS